MLVRLTPQVEFVPFAGARNPTSVSLTVMRRYSHGWLNWNCDVELNMRDRACAQSVQRSVH